MVLVSRPSWILSDSKQAVAPARGAAGGGRQWENMVMKADIQVDTWH